MICNGRRLQRFENRRQFVQRGNDGCILVDFRVVPLYRVLFKPDRIEAGVASATDVDAPVVTDVDGFFSGHAQLLQASRERLSIGFRRHTVLSGDDCNCEQGCQFRIGGYPVGAGVRLPLGVRDQTERTVLIG